MPGLTDEQRLLRDTVRDLADEKIAPRAAEIDRTAEFPWDVKELSLAAHDLFTLHFPERLGGVGGDLLTACLAIEQISRVCATSGLILAVQGLGGVPILVAGTEEQQQRWIPDLAAGRKLVAFALTEAEAGSDAAATRTRDVRDGDGFVLTGTKRFITGCRREPRVRRVRADRPGRRRRSKRLSAFLVMKDDPGGIARSAARRTRWGSAARPRARSC